MRFPGKSNGVACHFFLQGNLSDSGIELRSPALQLQVDSLLTELQRKLSNVNSDFLKKTDKGPIEKEVGIEVKSHI